MTKQIAVLSDTHLDSPNKTLVKIFDNYLLEMDALLHCGDFTEESVWAYLNSHPHFYAVAGNMDKGRWSSELPIKKTIYLEEEIKIGMIHGHGMEVDSDKLPEKILNCFPSDVDLICYGHSHRRELHSVYNQSKQIKILNPGSLFMPRDSKPGYAVIYVSEESMVSIEWISLMDLL